MPHTIKPDEFIFTTNGEDVKYPYPPLRILADTEMEIYAHFMRTFRHAVSSDISKNIQIAMECTAHKLGMNEADIASVLVSLGLKAPREAFPQSYLNFIDKHLLRQISCSSGDSQHYRLPCLDENVLTHSANMGGYASGHS